MPRFTTVQNSFKAGEISPKLDGRTDIEEYRNGLEEMTNMMPYRSGGSTRRPPLRVKGGVFGNADTVSKTIALIPLEFSPTEVFLVHIEIGAASDRTIFIEDISGAGTLNLALSGAVAGMTSVLAELAKITDIRGFHYVQKDDVLILTHNSGLMAPFVIYRYFNASSGTKPFGARTFYDTSLFTTEIPQFLLGMNPTYHLPVDDANSSAAEVQVSSTSGTATVTATTAIFVATDVNSTIILEDGSNKFISLVIQTFTSTTQVIGKVLIVTAAYPAATNTKFFYRSAWSDTRGWPRAVSIYENRLIFGGNSTYPSRLWASELNTIMQMNRFLVYKDINTGAYGRESDAVINSLGFGTTNQLPYQFTISSIGSDSISWLSSGRALMIGTSHKQLIATGNDSIISATNISVQPQSFVGSAPFMVAPADDRFYAISADGLSVIEFGFSNESGAYVSRNISILSDEIIHKGATDRGTRIEKLVFQDSTNTLWLLTTRDQLFGVTINRSSQVIAFHRHTVTNIDLYDMASVFQNKFSTMRFLGKNSDYPATGSSSEPISKYTHHRYEFYDFFEHPNMFNASTRLEDKGIFLDHSVHLTAASTATWRSRDLADLTVTVITLENVVYENVVCDDDGSFTLAAATTELYVGIPYTSRMKTMRPEVGPNELLNSQGDIITFDRATFKLYKTFAGAYGVDTDGEENKYDFEFPNTTGFTGSVKVDLPTSPDVDNRVIIETSKPYPLNVLSMVLRGVNNT